MVADHSALYNALSARDPRFDGLFFVGVTSTGIYCRPICPARTPKAANCRFFGSAAAAEKESFRPCLRCRPELAPGAAPVDDSRRIANAIARRIEEGLSDDERDMESIAAQFELSSRQIRRIVHREFGVSPIELVQTRRLLLAKQLLTETSLPITEVAYASGFASLRRFHDAFGRRYGMPPARLRRDAAGAAGAAVAGETLKLRLGYRPPFDWDGLLSFLSARALKGVEAVTTTEYARTVRLADHAGWIRVTNAPANRALVVEIAHSLTPALPALLGRLRHLFDLSARPDVIAAHLGQDPLLAPAVARHPGQRVPGAFDGFELALRAVLGQQISVKAATTLAGRVVDAFGDEIVTPHADLSRHTPTPERIARATADDVASLGLTRARAETVVTLAQAFAGGGLALEAGAEPDAAMRQLTALPGIGPWTASYVAMRALSWPDAFPKEDVALRNALGGVTPANAEARSQSWRPWRSYAVMHLWRGLGD